MEDESHLQHPVHQFLTRTRRRLTHQPLYTPGWVRTVKGTLHGPPSDEADLLKSFLAFETTQWPVTRRGDVSGRLALQDAGSVAGGHCILAARQPSSSNNLPICCPWTCCRGAESSLAPRCAQAWGIYYPSSEKMGVGAVRKAGIGSALGTGDAWAGDRRVLQEPWRALQMEVPVSSRFSNVHRCLLRVGLNNPCQYRVQRALPSPFTA